jgi:hypothetical protein
MAPALPNAEKLPALAPELKCEYEIALRGSGRRHCAFTPLGERAAAMVQWSKKWVRGVREPDRKLSPPPTLHNIENDKRELKLVITA